MATPTLAFKLWVRDQLPCVQAAITGPVPYTGVHGVIVNGTCRECGLRNLTPNTLREWGVVNAPDTDRPIHKERDHA